MEILDVTFTALRKADAHSRSWEEGANPCAWPTRWLQEAVSACGALILQARPASVPAHLLPCWPGLCSLLTWADGDGSGLSPEVFRAAQGERPPQPWLSFGLWARTHTFMMVHFLVRQAGRHHGASQASWESLMRQRLPHAPSMKGSFQKIVPS